MAGKIVDYNVGPELEGHCRAFVQKPHGTVIRHLVTESCFLADTR